MSEKKKKYLNKFCVHLQLLSHVYVDLKCKRRNHTVKISPFEKRMLQKN